MMAAEVSMTSRARLVGIALLAAAAAGPAAGEPLRRDEVPEPLRPWVDWVLRGHEAELCPALAGRAERGAEPSAPCAWPGVLALDLSDAGGRFEQRWTVYAESFAPLPGGESRFPEAVEVDGRPAPVVLRQGRPVVRLAPGSHAVRGELRFATLPEALVTPPETGLVALRLRGEPVAFPARDPDGRLWLRARAVAEGEEETRLELDVHRLVTDEVPLELRTRIELRAAGPSREVQLGPALPAGFVPIALDGPLPARLDPDGRLRVQVRPGTWTLTILARRDRPEPELVLPEPSGPWDADEVVAFEARPALREVELEGPPQVDPQQTRLPEAWRAFPAFVMQPGVALRFVEQRRGDADPAADRLQLQRTLWLDFDGSGYTVSDRITGEVNRSWRLEADPAVTLGRAALGGGDQLLTRRAGSDRVGLEVPQGPIELEADSRVDGRRGALPAVGWDLDVHGLGARLNLPPGWRLLHAAGVDRASVTWISRWTLLDLFVVLLVATALLRLSGPAIGALALAALGLSYTEPGAPQYLWIAVVAGEALRRVLAGGRLGRALRAGHGVLLALLVVVALAFALGQVRGALFPSLEDTRLFFGARGPEIGAAREPVARGEMDAVEEAEAVAPAAPMETREEAGYLSKRQASSAPLRARLSGDLYAQDPSARITTGPGLPRWQWRRVDLEWNGPVGRAQELRLWLLPPIATRALAFVRVVLLAALVLFLLRSANAGRGRAAPAAGPGAAAALAALLALALPGAARAELPGPELLDELRKRLLEPPACAPACAALPRLRLEATPSWLELSLRVDAGGRTAVPLPVPLRDWAPERVLVDGAAAPVRREGAYLWLAVEPGVHEITLAGALPAREGIEIPLPLRPQRVEARAEGWRVSGLLHDGEVGESLRLERTATRAGDEGRLAPGALPPFARVERHLRLGLTWEATTRVVRVSPPDATLLLEIPLLPGESVASARVRAEGGRALVTLAPGAREASFESILERRADLVLSAGEPGAFAETWVVEASPVWHLETDGIPPVHDPAPAGRRLRAWRPWPGERVALAVTRPEGVEGATVTIDASTLAVEPGLRATDATLTLHLRSSQGGQHRIVLPEGAALEGAQIDGAEQPLRQQGREVLVPLVPGAREVALRFREPRGASALFGTPAVDLGAPSANAELRVTPPAGRWTLLAGGPRLGPAVLFWPFLVVLAAVAVGLGRIRWTPLRTHHWLLLGLGLTQVPVAAAAVVAGWLLLLGWRERRGAALPGGWFDALQLAVVAVTLVALATLFHSIQMGLLGLPEMQIAGNGSWAGLLRWYQDRAAPEPEAAWVLSVPLLVYRLAMLAWALWLAQAVVRWLRWGWRCFTTGEVWRSVRGAPRA
jgi:hypothetical protein